MHYPFAGAIRQQECYRHEFPVQSCADEHASRTRLREPKPVANNWTWDQWSDHVTFDHLSDGEIEKLADKIRKDPGLMQNFKLELTKLQVALGSCFLMLRLG